MNPNDIYQIEFATNQDGSGKLAVWYDLSTQDGNPYINVNRFMQIGNPSVACKALFNSPGSTIDDWNNFSPPACELASLPHDLTFLMARHKLTHWIAGSRRVVLALLSTSSSREQRWGHSPRVPRGTKRKTVSKRSTAAA